MVHTLMSVLLLLVTVLGVSLNASAQSSQDASQRLVTIVGTVLDGQSDKPLRGATVQQVGTSRGAYTSSSGGFSLRCIKQDSILLRVSFVGYAQAQLSVAGDSSSVDVGPIRLEVSSRRQQEVIVTANKRVQAVQDVPISVSIVKTEDLAQRGIVRLDEALRYVSGISIARDQVSIRGASGFALGVGSRTMVMMDGFPLISGDNGDIKFDVMPVADIERIEVIKGAGSALYGTGALGGVVSIITKQPTDVFSVSGRVYAGLYTDQPYEKWEYMSGYPLLGGADVRAGQRVGNWSYSVSGGYRRDQGYRQFDETVRGFGFAKVTYALSEASNLRFNLFHAADQRQNFLYWKGLDNATRPPAVQDINERIVTSKTAAGLEYSTVISDEQSFIARYGVFRTMFETLNPAAETPAGVSIALAHSADLQHTASVLSTVTLTSGLSARVNSVTSPIYEQTLQHLVSVFSQAELNVGAGALLTAGLRLDREETLTLKPHLELSPKLGLSIPVSEDLSLRASVGRGFRAPTVAERYANTQYGPFRVRPNPSVMAESSVSSEIGIAWRNTTFLPFELDIAIFDNELYSLIEPSFDLTTPGIPIVFTNLTRARILGMEGTLRFAITKDLMAETGLTLMDPTDLTLGSILKYRNRVLWYSRAMWSPLAGVSLQAEYRYQDRVQAIDDRLSLFVTDADVRVPLHLVDLRLFADASDHLRCGVIVRNALNYAYTESIGNLGPLRTVLLQVEMR
ncbi:MAG: TonB-dependent receptor [Candidatus Kapabacteria bacterium]|nr:TonB-dependent receptor [Candidatus Kapabacteria bacterium]